MSPQNRDNLRAMVVAGCDGDDYGKLVSYSFPKGELVYSPVQIDALINADPEIVRQFSLWDMSGSEIQRGTMIILPAGNNIYYVQPVFLTARAGQHQIPELQRTVMSEGQVAVMNPSIEGSYQRLNSRLAKLEQEVTARFSLSSEQTEETKPPR